MRFVLDTHAALWAQVDAKRLSAKVRAALAGLPPADLAVSDVSLTEAARLLFDGRLTPVNGAPGAWLERFALCYTVLPVAPRIAWAAASFAWSHRDPCDRHIVATALVQGLPLVTIDPVMTAFAPTVGVTVVW
ncbi:MAG: type II toxin-antitoxin system VapC family toxin [Opitutaceae bacterium]|nr:type II toxin-antitoxin system VapC family toxin [Opitutaceae bacterium]